MKKVFKIGMCIIIYFLAFTKFIYAEGLTAKIGNNEYTWYNLPEGLTPQQVPSSEHVKEIKNMKSTVYGLFGDVAKGSCSYGIGTTGGFEYCKDQLGTSYGITPSFAEAAEKSMIPRVVATAYSKNGNTFEIPRGTLIYIKSNVAGVNDYGYAIVADTGGAVEKGELDLYMPYAANNTKTNDAEKFNFGLDYRELLKLDKKDSITVYITKYTLTKDKYIYMTTKGTVVDNASSTSSSENAGVNKKVIYNNTKTVTTSGTKPTTPTTNCKDVEATYWSKTTTISGDGALDSQSSIGSMINSSPSKVITEMVEKAIAMAEKGGITYSQESRQLVDTKEKLDTMTATDCSGLVYSLYKSYLGINIGTTTYDIYDKVVAQTDYGDGWTGVIAEYNQDTSVLQPGDVLLRRGTGKPQHVGIYVGNGKVVHHGSGIGPKMVDVPSGGEWRYTYYIRYRKAGSDASSVVTAMQEVYKSYNLTDYDGRTWDKVSMYQANADYAWEKWGTYVSEIAPQFGVDPLWVLSKMSFESGGGKYSGFGSGAAAGPMQIQKSVHLNNSITAKNVVTGKDETIQMTREALSDDKTNIKIGIMMYANQLAACGNNPYLAAQKYNYGNIGFVSTYASRIGKSKDDIMADASDVGWVYESMQYHLSQCSKTGARWGDGYYAYKFALYLQYLQSK